MCLPTSDVTVKLAGCKLQLSPYQCYFPHRIPNHLTEDSSVYCVLLVYVKPLYHNRYHFIMMSYDGVIRKRLRLKGHPEIPPYVAPVDETALAATPSSEQTVTGPPAHADSNLNPGMQNEKSLHPQAREEEGGVGVAGVVEQGQEPEQEEEEEQDARTEAEKQHEKIMLQREEERIKRESSKSHREKIDVCYRVSILISLISNFSQLPVDCRCN